MPIDGEMDISEEECLSAGFLGGQVGALGRTEEPEEGCVIKVQGFIGAGDDGCICRVGSRRRAVLVTEGFEESREWGMVVFGSWSLLSGIQVTQVGDPLSHGQQGFGYGVSLGRLAGLADFLVSESKDQEKADFLLCSGDVSKGRLDPVLLAELDPAVEDGALGLVVLSCGGLVCERERSVEISFGSSLGHQPEQLPRFRLWIDLVKVGKKLLISHVLQARRVIAHAICISGDAAHHVAVPVLPLVQAL